MKNPIMRMLIAEIAKIDIADIPPFLQEECFAVADEIIKKRKENRRGKK